MRSGLQTDNLLGFCHTDIFRVYRESSVKEKVSGCSLDGNALMPGVKGTRQIGKQQ